ncbi:glycosyltransferase family 4 protein [Bacillus shivajii]|uniref:glycosyltransferase family 4 protein n=1 Tax=Bacillus shivajii TaxID=1983719 RepID=UPI001CFAFB76|nr:glycosyltransferase family 4 protein [Bacillus shivajii]UCZ51610.1 glycosyltransferase family 4 protein [Bacillus shivajii]
MKCENKKNVAFFTPYYKENRGNATTAKRLEALLTNAGWNINIFAYDEEEWTKEHEQLLKKAHIIHVLHFRRFAEWMKNHDIAINQPLVITSGGTDVNQDLFDKEKMKRMSTLLNKSAALTVFTEDAKQKLRKHLPSVEKVHVIPQTPYFPEGNCEYALKENGEPILFLPAGLRKVKDVLYLKEEVNTLKNTQFPHLKLLIAGSIIEEEVYKEVLNAEREYDWLHYIGEVPYECMNALYEKVDVVINTSLHEGQSGALLEAMAKQCFILARKNPGNESIVGDDENGLLFTTPEEFITKFLNAYQNEKIKSQIIKNATEFMKSNFDPNGELSAYERLYGQVLKGSRINC